MSGPRPGGAQHTGESTASVGLDAPALGEVPGSSGAGSASKSVMPSCDGSWDTGIAGSPLVSHGTCGSGSDGQKAQKHPSLAGQGLRENVPLIVKSLFLL